MVAFSGVLQTTCGWLPVKQSVLDVLSLSLQAPQFFPSYWGRRKLSVSKIIKVIRFYRNETSTIQQSSRAMLTPEPLPSKHGSAQTLFWKIISLLGEFFDLLEPYKTPSAFCMGDCRQAKGKTCPIGWFIGPKKGSRPAFLWIRQRAHSPRAPI